ncbi:transketolase family protein [Patescibacteria group bacterium]|nr:transketolase family protein [Patescibacteria group bacterium]
MPNKYIEKNIKQKSTRDGFGDGILELGKKNKDVIVVSADLAESTRVDKFAKKYPNRFVEVGVAEQNMMGVAAGLSFSDKIVYATSFGVFNPGRNWDQIRVSVAYSKANVKIIASHTGLSVGEDGASHQALEDIALMRVLPNITVLAPADYNETKKATIMAAKIKGPVYIRFARQASAEITSNNPPFKIGRANILKTGKDLTIVGCGPILEEALLAEKELKKKNISVEIINCHTIKPLDKATILRSVKKTKHLITVEDHQVAGGMGSAIVEMLAENFPVPTMMIGVRDSFGESGEPKDLWDKYGLSYPNIVNAALKILKK